MVTNEGGKSAAMEEPPCGKKKNLCKNHGRIVVLPYIKENVERVQSQTKNSAHDGKAAPRHPDLYVTLPIEMLDGDLMIGLFGELQYE